MKPSQQEIISRHSLLWLLIINVVILLPLYDKLTPWTMAICGICLVWRYGIFMGKVAKPPRFLVTSLALASALTLALVTSKIGLLNGLINLLILGYSLKYIEMIDRRDVRIVVIVGYILIAITLLGQQSIYFSILLIFIATINTCVLVSLYREDVKLNETARIGVSLIIQSLPLAALLFLVFPRLPPLWMMPQLKTAQTGLSDEVSFGEIGRLTRSTALAFRVKFDGTPPMNHQLYWRALVLEDYDGQTWTRHESIKTLESNNLASSSMPSATGPWLNYSVIAEKSNQHWLFALDVAFSDTLDIIQLPDYRLYSTKSLTQTFQYNVKSFTSVPMDLSLTDNVRNINLRLPEQSNPRTHQLAESFATRYPNPVKRLNAMMSYFTEQAYFYTLSPPPVGPQQIDDFLLENKAGFCVHYASALTFMARASGIPARMVTGYQGGEWNKRAQYLSIYQYMAHAWVEVWLEGRGWIRLDPTSMIAPERILEGFDAYFQGRNSYFIDSPFSALRLRDYPLLNELRLTLASIDFYWSVWVLGFDSSKQEQVLHQLLGTITKQKLAFFMLTSLSLIILVIAYSAGLLHFTRDKDKVSSAYLRVCRLLHKKGVSRRLDQGPLDFCLKVETQLPVIAEDFSQLTQYYIALKYRTLTASGRKSTTKLFIRLSRKLKLKIIKL
ncbi:transglutaminase TgpA family protein [Shewanella violacea]|uniref:Transglutaminase family protein n=1 Tax=Shewanella violacea (strain JCM 10179 / CIP 106290 / LMG 19151 / DSS12) TaxID=637905 RepID=D4ZL28_SHEVD|nr:DUF3488 and transglutaminase-like domain-containing protein [Shewanella violacea]BAJ02377.1 transglutaminase family protein [Shewanella violacea DSS12]